METLIESRVLEEVEDNLVIDLESHLKSFQVTKFPWTRGENGVYAKARRQVAVEESNRKEQRRTDLMQARISGASLSPSTVLVGSSKSMASVGAASFSPPLETLVPRALVKVDSKFSPVIPFKEIAEEDIFEMEIGPSVVDAEKRLAESSVAVAAEKDPVAGTCIDNIPKPAKRGKRCEWRKLELRIDSSFGTDASRSLSCSPHKITASPSSPSSSQPRTPKSWTHSPEM